VLGAADLHLGVPVELPDLDQGRAHVTVALPAGGAPQLLGVAVLAQVGGDGREQPLAVPLLQGEEEVAHRRRGLVHVEVGRIAGVGDQQTEDDDRGQDAGGDQQPAGGGGGWLHRGLLVAGPRVEVSARDAYGA
jgi:hypothetical protein